jgi:hypothetical protein
LKVVPEGDVRHKNKKKGAGASPLRQLTPQNQNTVEVVFRPPREANIFICRSRVQVGCQRRFKSTFRIHTIETMGVSQAGTIWGGSSGTAILQNLTDTVARSSILWEMAAEVSPQAKNASTANCSTDRRRNGFTKSLHIGCVLGFDHDARQRLCSGVSQHDAPIVA